MTTVYLSGPMTGIREFNFPAFDSLTQFLAGRECRALSITKVISPAEHDREVLWKEKRTVPVDVPGYAEGDAALYAESIGMIHDLLRWDFEMIMHEADAIVMLPGWERSSGARSERLVAEATGKTVYLAHDHGTTAQYSQEGILLHREQHWAISTDLDQRRCHNELARAFSPPSTSTAVANPDGEVRIVDPVTGGEKGRKLARMELLPGDALVAVAEHFGRGAAKYAERNWEKGYDWSLSFGSLQRHSWAWWQGAEIDEDGFLHRDAMAWHALVLLAFALRGTGNDDRPNAAPALVPSSDVWHDDPAFANVGHALQRMVAETRQRLANGRTPS